MTEKQQLWLLLAKEKFPLLSEASIMALSLDAATRWYHGDTDELANLYDQYVMLKTLKDIPSNAADYKDNI